MTESDIEILIQNLGLLTDDERQLVFIKICDKFCMHCGRLAPKHGCHCENDD